MKKRKMAFVDLTNFKDWPAGGMLQYELAILPFLSNSFDLDIWGVSVDGSIDDTLDINGNSYHINIWGNAKTMAKLVPNYWRGLQLIAKKSDFKKYDVVYVHTGSCAVALSKIIDKKKTLLVYHQHGLSHLNDKSPMSLIQRPFVNKAQYVSDVVFIVSDKKSVSTYLETIKNRIKGNFYSIGSPIDLSLFSINKNKNCERKIKLIYTGRIDSHKNVVTLIEMVGQLNQVYSDFSLTIVGDGSEKNIVVEKIKQLGIENKVFLKGAQPRTVVLEELQEADIYVTASIGEGVSISVLEAYASGLPVVCFNVPGLSKQVINNVTGRVVEVQDICQMANAVVEVKNELERFSDNVIDEVKKYDNKKIAEQIVNVINENIKKEEII